MEGQPDRRRSPSVGHQQNHSLGHASSSPNFPEHASFHGVDPASTFNASHFTTATPPNGAEQYNYSAAYLNPPTQAPSFQQATITHEEYSSQDLEQTFKRNSISNGSSRPPSLHLHDSNHQFAEDFDDSFHAHSLGAKQEPAYDNVFMLDPSLQPGGQPPSQSINPADVMASMSPQQDHMALPANLMQIDTSNSSPSMQHSQYYSPGHSRHVSLDPASAGYSHVPQSADWSGMRGASSFQNHRRAPSEHSDVSSVAPSPFLTQDVYDPYEHNHSPLMHPEQDGNLYQESLGIERFTISDAQQAQRQGLSPRHSPYPSPRMSPHQGLGLVQENSFILPSNDMSDQMGGGPGPQMYNGQGEPAYPDYRMKNDSSDMGQAAQMAPPEINVELAPPSRLTVESGRMENDMDALSPPDRGKPMLPSLHEKIHTKLKRRTARRPDESKVRPFIPAHVSTTHLGRNIVKPSLYRTERPSPLPLPLRRLLRR